MPTPPSFAASDSPAPPASDPSPCYPHAVVTVALGDRSYPIHIGQGLLANAGSTIRDALPQTRKLLILCDPAMEKTCRERLLPSLQQAGLTVGGIHKLPGGEQAKSLSFYAESCEALLAMQPDRQTALVAFGGGITGDLTGFVAATLLRGLPFVQIPTTLLAQVDSSVGGKTGLNSRYGKNLIGAFHQPSLVLADSDVLTTLPERERKAGYAEIVKTALIQDAPFFHWLEEKGHAVLAGDLQTTIEAVRRCCAAKAAIVSADETEQDRRALLNLGHTFGHALEAELGYDNRLLHGEAVSIGLHLAFGFSARKGLCPQTDAARVTEHLQHLHMPWDMRTLAHRWHVDALMQRMMQDKKTLNGQLTLILARGIGHCFLDRTVPEAEIVQFWQEVLA